MAEVIRHWAGKERLFRLDLGRILELEQACDDAIGSIFSRVCTGRFRANDLTSILRIGLEGGGATKVQAKHLVDTFFDRLPYMENASIAGDILSAIMVGIEEGETASASGEPERIVFSEVVQICRVFNMSPHDLKVLTYAEFLNLVRGFNASSDRKAAPPTEEEFMDILARYEPEALNG
ncbi:MAG: gene transfer agent family protein [Rhodobacteraceae bacterium]|nr:gene transfer agent family protein [Paracoccaceae bacterium]MBR9820717.1 gene transfer agent family protein [Paracoccaceae bacterium]